MSIFAKIFGGAEASPTDGFLLFDYNQMPPSYGEAAFRAIALGLRRAPGVCAFHDGDVDSETVLKLAGEAKHVSPANKSSPLAKLNAKRTFGAYLVGMWTDHAANFETVHSHLGSKPHPGYLGLFTMADRHEQLVFAMSTARKLSLSVSITLRNGAVDPETSKYGIR